MNWKAVLHSIVVALASVVVGAVEQYFQNGGIVPQNSTQWHSFLATIGGTVVLGIAALLKSSPLAPPPPNPNPNPPAPPTPPAAH